MLEFADQELALQFLAQGDQALYVLPDSERESASPPVPKGGNRYMVAVRGMRPTTVAHLYDLDEERLIRTAVRLGVPLAVIRARGSKRQHIELRGWAVARAQRLCVGCK